MINERLAAGGEEGVSLTENNIGFTLGRYFFAFFQAPMTNAIDELKVLNGIRNGDEQCFRQLFNVYWSKLYLIAKNVLLNQDDAEDIVQEVFLDIWNRREKLDVTNIGGYMYVAVRHGIARKLKGRKLTEFHETLFESIQDSLNVETDIAYDDLVAFVKGRISFLPDRCREVFELSRFHHLTNQEIAEKLGISKSTVENQINKALKYLKNDPELSGELFVLYFILLLR